MIRVAGVDGGGTRMRAVIVDERGRELGRGEAPGAVVGVDRLEEVASRVATAVRAAAAAAGTPLPVSVLWAGLAGAGRETVREAAVRALETEELTVEVVVVADVEAAFSAAFGSGPGILLIAGTGSIAWARGDDGEVVRVGGWGERLGDEGSGYAVGLEALRAVARATDGRGPSTVLTQRALGHLGVARAEDLIEWIATAGKRDVASLVPIVARASAEGDPVASSIMDATVADLVGHLAVALERAGPWTEPPELVLCGGLLEEGGPLREATERAVSEYAVRSAARRIDPAMGAARTALDHARPQPPEA